MWETAALHVLLSMVGKKVKVRGLPHLAKNERDMGHPMLCGREKDRIGRRNLFSTQKYLRTFLLTFTFVALPFFYLRCLLPLEVAF
jgi:hypothetical protein